MSDKMFRWEHAGKGKKRAFSTMTQAHYVWDGSNVRVEARKGDWQQAGEAKTLEQADQVAGGYDSIIGHKLVEHHRERAVSLEKAAEASELAAVFNKLFGKGTERRELYESFCKLRKEDMPCGAIAGAMQKMSEDARNELVEVMEHFRKQGRR
jgi:hypothetical protein